MLRGSNFENCKNEPYINGVILRTSLYCKFFDDRSTWLKDCRYINIREEEDEAKQVYLVHKVSSEYFFP